MVAGGGVLDNQFYAFRGGPAWHKKGTVYDTDQFLTAVEAYDTSKGGLEPPIRKYAAVAWDADAGKPVMDPTAPANAPTPLYLPGQAIFRWPTEQTPKVEFFSLVSDKHVNLTNREVCEALDASGITKTWPVETMGVLDGGRAFFTTLDAGEWAIKGDPMKTYLLVRDGKDGQRSFQIAITVVRVVCTNTERWALEEATINITVSHDQAMRGNITLYSHVIPQLMQAQARVREMRSRLAEVRFSEEMAQEVFDAAWPIPKPPKKLGSFADESVIAESTLSQTEIEALQKVKDRYEYRRERVVAIHDGARELLGIRNDDFVRTNPELAGTGHVVANVVSEIACYRQGHLNSKKDKTVTDSILLGERGQEITRGYNKAFELATA